MTVVTMRTSTPRVSTLRLAKWTEGLHDNHGDTDDGQSGGSANRASWTRIPRHQARFPGLGRGVGPGAARAVAVGTQHRLVLGAPSPRHRGAGRPLSYRPGFRHDRETSREKGPRPPPGQDRGTPHRLDRGAHHRLEARDPEAMPRGREEIRLRFHLHRSAVRVRTGPDVTDDRFAGPPLRHIVCRGPRRRLVRHRQLHVVFAARAGHPAQQPLVFGEFRAQQDV